MACRQCIEIVAARSLQLLSSDSQHARFPTPTLPLVKRMTHTSSAVLFSFTFPSLPTKMNHLSTVSIKRVFVRFSTTAQDGEVYWQFELFNGAPPIPSLQCLCLGFIYEYTHSTSALERFLSSVKEIVMRTVDTLSCTCLTSDS